MRKENAKRHQKYGIIVIILTSQMQPISQARLARTPRCYSAAAFIVDPREARVLYAKSRLHYIETRQKRGFLHDGIYYSSQLSKMLQDNNPHETEARRKFFFAKVPKI